MEYVNNKTMNVKIVCPKAEELSVIVNDVRCDECGISFRNEPRLRMHVLKTHEHKDLKKNVKEDVHYHCPESMCIYASKSQRFFKTMKYLKQHYLKVHAAKRFPCSQCEKKFSTMAAQLAHLRVCGIHFACSCLKVFGTYEALLTHSKRSSHTIDEKYKKMLLRKPQVNVPAKFISAPKGTQPILILPRKSNFSYPETSGKVSFDVAVQTDEIKRQKRTPSPTKTSKKRESRQTQTSPSGKEKRARKTVETQTMQKVSREKILLEKREKFLMKNVPSKKTSKEEILSDMIHSEKNPSEDKMLMEKKSSPEDILREKDIRKKEMVKNCSEKKNTYSKDPSLNDNFGADDMFSSSPVKLEHELEDFWEEKNTSLGTQTSPEKDLLEALSDSVTQTDFVSFYEGEEPNCLNIENCYSFDSRNQITRSDPMLTTNSFEDRFSSIETQTETGNRQYFQADVARNFTLSSNTQTQTETESWRYIESEVGRNFAMSSNETQTETGSCHYFEPDVARNFAFSSNNETQTETGSRQYFEEEVARNFALSSNNETQTTENFDNIDQLLYSNTCTQTCNDILPPDLELSDIQTQTAWPELYPCTISSHTQTPLTSGISSSCRSWLNTRTTHTETQTDLFNFFDEFA